MCEREEKKPTRTHAKTTTTTTKKSKVNVKKEHTTYKNTKAKKKEGEKETQSNTKQKRSEGHTAAKSTNERNGKTTKKGRDSKQRAKEIRKSELDGNDSPSYASLMAWVGRGRTQPCQGGPRKRDGGWVVKREEMRRQNNNNNKENNQSTSRGIIIIIIKHTHEPSCVFPKRFERRKRKGEWAKTSGERFEMAE